MKKRKAHEPAMPAYDQARDKEERISELLAANNALVERERKAKEELRAYQKTVEGIVRIMDMTGNDVIGMRLLRRLIKYGPGGVGE